MSVLKPRNVSNESHYQGVFRKFMQLIKSTVCSFLIYPMGPLLANKHTRSPPEKVSSQVEPIIDRLRFLERPTVVLIRRKSNLHRK